jgi:hypothetical protein
MNSKQFWIKKAIGFGFCMIAVVALTGWVVMLLWNNVLAEVTTVKIVTYWQAMGLLLLSKVLFGGFNKWGGKHKVWSNEMKEKWHHMSAEEKEKFKLEWRSKCNTWKKKTEESFAGTE